MERWPTGREASAGVGASPYVRHRPEQTLLYQLVRDNDPAFKADLAEQGSTVAGLRRAGVRRLPQVRPP